MVYIARRSLSPKSVFWSQGSIWYIALQARSSNRKNVKNGAPLPQTRATIEVLVVAYTTFLSVLVSGCRGSFSPNSSECHHVFLAINVIDVFLYPEYIEFHFQANTPEISFEIWSSSSEERLGNNWMHLYHGVFPQGASKTRCIWERAWPDLDVTRRLLVRWGCSGESSHGKGLQFLGNIYIPDRLTSSSGELPASLIRVCFLRTTARRVQRESRYFTFTHLKWFLSHKYLGITGQLRLLGGVYGMQTVPVQRYVIPRYRRGAADSWKFLNPQQEELA